MNPEHEIIGRVMAAKESSREADSLISDYIPFIRAEATKFLSRLCTQQDDEYSIAMIAFHEAINGYRRDRGSFLGFAALTIRSRLIDFARKEARHRGHSYLDAETSEDGATLADTISDPDDPIDESHGLEATKQEIAELCAVMEGFGLSLGDIADNSPRQGRTLEACRRVVSFAIGSPGLLDELLRTKKLPISTLSSGAGVDKKTLERHRKYILAMLIIQTNGYEMIRGHIRHVLDLKGGIA